MKSLRVWIAGLFVAAMFATAYATFESHVHTANGTINTTLNCSPYGSHKLRVFAPTVGNIHAYVWKSGIGNFGEVTAEDSDCNTAIFNCSYDNVLFSSWTFQQTSGTGRAYFADANNLNLPNCADN